MSIYKLKEKLEYTKEYFELCAKEWGTFKDLDEFNQKIKVKTNQFLENKMDKIISVLLLLENDKLVGFISLFKYDGDERKDLTPWYATMYVKEEYRGKGYSQILNEAILNEAKRLGYNKVYLKSDLINYYEKFGAKYIETLNNGEKLFYIDLNK